MNIPILDGKGRSWSDNDQNNVLEATHQFALQWHSLSKHSSVYKQEQSIEILQPLIVTIPTSFKERKKK